MNQLYQNLSIETEKKRWKVYVKWFQVEKLNLFFLVYYLLNSKEGIVCVCEQHIFVSRIDEIFLRHAQIIFSLPFHAFYQSLNNFCNSFWFLSTTRHAWCCKSSIWIIFIFLILFLCTCCTYYIQTWRLRLRFFVNELVRLPLVILKLK